MIIDFHSHILPCIDDGSKSVEMSLEMLKLVSSSGVDVQILTPHFYAHKNSIDRYLLKREESYNQLIKALEESDFNCPKIYLGAEVAYFQQIKNAEALNKLTINNSKVLLLEMPFYKWDQSIIDDVTYLIEIRHFTVIIAHLERYFSLGHTTKKYIKQLLELPVYVQINAESLSDKKVLKLFENKQAHILGSDTHNLDKRPPNLIDGRNMIEKKLGKGALERIDDISFDLLREIDHEI